MSYVDTEGTWHDLISLLEVQDLEVTPTAQVSSCGAAKADGERRKLQSKPDSACGPRRRRDTWWPQKRRTRGGVAEVEAQGWPGTARAGAA